MARCVACSAETELYNNGDPICIACDEGTGIPTARVQESKRAHTADENSTNRLERGQAADG